MKTILHTTDRWI